MVYGVYGNTFWTLYISILILKVGVVRVLLLEEVVVGEEAAAASASAAWTAAAAVVVVVVDWPLY